MKSKSLVEAIAHERKHAKQFFKVGLEKQAKESEQRAKELTILYMLNY